MNTRTVAASLAGMAVLLGCETADPIACTAQVVPGIALLVVDAATGAPVLDSVTVAVRDGDFEEFPETTGSGGFHAVHERPGTYEVAVTHPRFEPWERDGLRVEAGVCHVTTVGVTAELVAR
ncbi:carboxypeptidase-like regulatory domain-containing protein [Gaopeijia maritima]|uniref:carboxypeptidase-like regulatory domain-containing protein n=1 Tax=Gaopeijia maritima TaxID=3119007 RepID=UPI00324B75FC